MSMGKTIIVVALLGVAGCARNDQLACGPALPPITSTVQAAPAAPAAVAAAPAAVAVPVAAAPLTPDQERALALQNRAAVAGR
jgi:hypothetical protein